MVVGVVGVGVGAVGVAVAVAVGVGVAVLWVKVLSPVPTIRSAVGLTPVLTAPLLALAMPSLQ